MRFPKIHEISKNSYQISKNSYQNSKNSYQISKNSYQTSKKLKSKLQKLPNTGNFVKWSSVDFVQKKKSLGIFF